MLVLSLSPVNGSEIKFPLGKGIRAGSLVRTFCRTSFRVRLRASRAPKIGLGSRFPPSACCSQWRCYPCLHRALKGNRSARSPAVGRLTKPQSHSVPLEALRVPAKQRKHEKKPRDIGKGYGPSLLKPAACGPRLLHDARDRNTGGRPEPNHRAAEPNGVS